MVITGLALQNLRSHKNFVLKFTEKTTIIVGDNAMGKTSIIEALSLLSTGDSFRAGKIEEMINFDSDLARVKGVVSYESDSILSERSLNLDQKNEKDEIEIILTHGEVNGRRTQHRLFTVNGVKRRKKDAIGKFYSVVFRPEDMRLIEGSPSRRRGFLNNLLSMISPQYEVAFKNYEQTLKRRNKLLMQVREREQPRTSLQYWNLSLVKYGEIIQKHRQDFLASFSSVGFPVNFEIEYDPSIISQSRIEEYIDREIASGHSLVGPHKDDIIIFLTQKNRRLRLDTFGSRGQQRLGVLWLKFCELEYLAATTKKTLLLLDDILSELDDDSKALALSVLEKYQSVITTTDEGVVEEIKRHTNSYTVLNLKNLV
ncbi:DNA replication/repair protein RecF [Candidatus Woesebacteria bacterium]|nr:DNA replication/repair protein RecF [Candidatus Woesebacteria bacterium]